MEWSVPSAYIILVHSKWEFFGGALYNFSFPSIFFIFPIKLLLSSLLWLNLNSWKSDNYRAWKERKQRRLRAITLEVAIEQK